ncbi:MAG: LapA family protein [Sphaerospermopsis sp. SIO1G1]|nr:LapA family protein [Sphaerospermopsis sp. SIO1G1]
MTKIRLILLAVILVGLITLLAQNLSPSLSLVFLGMRTQPLPLALWILFSMTAGGLTYVLLATLIKFTNNFANSVQSSSEQFSARTKSPRFQRNSREETIPGSRSSQTFVDDDYDLEDDEDEFDDWDLDNSEDDDWEFTQARSRRRSQSPRDKQIPDDFSESDSAYSYSSQTPQNTGIGKTESVYDADYRVIVPPYQPLDNSQSDNSDDDDWSFFEDDENDEDRPNH